jgi:hypothetical protein
MQLVIALTIVQQVGIYGSDTRGWSPKELKSVGLNTAPHKSKPLLSLEKRAAGF